MSLTPYEHAEAIKEALDGLEAAHLAEEDHTTIGYHIARVHKRLGKALEEHGELLLEFTPGQVVALGGGTPKSPPPTE